MKEIILASNSPRRKEILLNAGIKFKVKTSKYKELYSKYFDEEIVKKNSLNKVSSVIKEGVYPSLIIGADTIVTLYSVCLVKPRNIIEAFFMLKKLSDKTHKVITSHTVADSVTGKSITQLSTSFVTFRKLGSFEIIRYIISKNPLDKAGSYGIQDFIKPDEVSNPPEGSFIKKLDGSYYNVMGLDIDLILSMIKMFEK